MFVNTCSCDVVDDMVIATLKAASTMIPSGLARQVMLEALQQVGKNPEGLIAMAGAFGKMAGKDDLMKIITSNPEVFKAYLNGGAEAAENLLKYEDEIIQAGIALSGDELIALMDGGKAALHSADEVVEAGAKVVVNSGDEIVEAGVKVVTKSGDEIVEAGVKAVTNSSDEVAEAGARTVVNSSDAGSEAAVIEGIETATEETILEDLASASPAVEGRFTESQIEKILNELQSDGFKNNPLRQAYEEEVTNLADMKKSLLEQNLSNEQASKILHQTRRDIGVEYKDVTPQPLRDYIYELNQNRYGDPLGPTYDYLIKSGKTYEQIMESACKPNPDIDRLFSGFEEWLRSQ